MVKLINVGLVGIIQGIMHAIGEMAKYKFCPLFHDLCQQQSD